MTVLDTIAEAKAAEPVIPSASAVGMLAKGQLRIAVAALGGSLVLHHVLPSALVNDQTVDLTVGALLVLGMSAWQWARTKLVHSKLFALASDPAIPDTKAKVADATTPANV